MRIHMKFSTIGSYLLDDIICYAKNVLKEDVVNVGRYTCISPISLCYGYECNDEEADELMLSCENKYQRNMHRLDIRKTLLKEIKKANPDYILIDFSEIFSPVKVYDIDGKKIAFTYHGYMKEQKPQLSIPQLLSVSTLSSQGLLNYARAYIEKLINTFGKDRLIMVETKYCYQYFDNKGKWNLVNDVNAHTSKNKVLNEIYEYVVNELQIKHVDLPKLLVNDLNYNVQSEFKLAEIYYEYLYKLLDGTIHNTIAKIDNEQFELRLEEYIDTKTMPDLAKQIKANGIDSGKELILIGHSKPLEKILKEQYNAKFSKRIEYNRHISDAELFTTTEFLQGKSRQFYLVIPHLYNSKDIIAVILRRAFVFNFKLLTWLHPHYFVEDIIGSYFDIFNNEIYSESEHCKINLWGSGNQITILKNKISKLINIVCRDQSNISIGKNNIFNDIITINMSLGARLKIESDTIFEGLIYLLTQIPFGEIVIGKYARIESGVKMLSGDGHAICDITSKKDKFYKTEEASSAQIIIDERCLICRESYLINCKINKDTIIYPLSVVTKNMPNNCIVAGVPAKVIRKDIAWSREINCYDIDDPLFGVPEEYRNFTEDNS